MLMAFAALVILGVQWWYDGRDDLVIVKGRVIPLGQRVRGSRAIPQQARVSRGGVSMATLHRIERMTARRAVRTAQAGTSD